MTKRIPGATYRLQFNGDFTFTQAREVAGYLHELGITDCYASPLFKARAESNHGYDVCDFGQLNPNLGGAAEFENFVARLRQLNMGLLLDMVPNHMSTDTSNAWWFDVLENGPNSKCANWFDIDWQRFSDNKIVLPILEDEFEKVLAAGKIRLVFESKKFCIAYHDRRFPLSPESQAVLSEEVAEPGPDFLKQFNGSPGKTSSFQRLNNLLKKQYYRLAYWRSGQINYRRFFDVNELVSMRMELPEVFEATHRLISDLVQQEKVTALRVDHPDGLWNPRQYLDKLQQQFGQLYIIVEKILTDDETLPADWPADGTTGYDFLNCLNGLFVDQKNKHAFDRIYREFTGQVQDFNEMVYQAKKYVLQNSFACELNALTRHLENIGDLVCSRQREPRPEGLKSGEADGISSQSAPPPHVGGYVPFEHNALAKALIEVLACFPVYRTYLTEDATGLSASDRNHVEHAIRCASLKVSKRKSDVWEDSDGRAPPYLAPERGAVPKERSRLAQRFNVGEGTQRPSSPEGTAEQAASLFTRLAASRTEPLDFIRDLLLLLTPVELDETLKHLCRQFVMKFQQLTGPLMAKALEDTTFYNFNRLTSLNEVGGNPDPFGSSIEDFHNYNLQKLKHWPHSLLATATHDTKRGEDVRARINVLSEIPDDFQAALGRWQNLNKDKKSVVDGMPSPDPNDQYLFYQTLIGAWPETTTDQRASFRTRMVDYMLKAIKESKRHTSWVQCDAGYESATRKFVEMTLEDSPTNTFLQDFESFHQKIAFFGRLNSLSQILLKMTAPGVPDFYQGTEFWDLNLVDPDNRRPVDYEIRRRVLGELKTTIGKDSTSNSRALADLFKDDQIGRSKLYLIWRVLAFRNRHRALFDSGAYLPLNAVGSKQAHIVAFARVCRDQTIIVAVPRLITHLVNSELPLGAKIWTDTQLLVPENVPSQFSNVLTDEPLTFLTSTGGKQIPVAQLFGQFPLALLSSTNST